MEAPEDHLPSYRIRPRFEIATPYSVEALTNKISLALKKEDATCQGMVSTVYATIYIPEEEQHYWSPQLSLYFKEKENGCLLLGRYGPKPNVWTMFVFFYSIIGFAILIISLFGFSNYALGNSSRILFFVPALMLVFLSLYFVAYSGQKMGHDQMLILHEFIEKSIGLNIV